MNEVIRALTQRRSCKNFAPRQVDEAALEEILLAGTWAANGMGRQSPKILVLQRKEDIEALERLNAAVIGKPELHPFYGAPTVCAVLADASALTAVEDASLVIGNMMAAAWSLGVGSCWIHRAKEEFATPEGKALLERWGITGDYIGVGHCVLGYPAVQYRPGAPRKPDYIVRIP